MKWAHHWAASPSAPPKHCPPNRNGRIDCESVFVLLFKFSGWDTEDRLGVAAERFWGGRCGLEGELSVMLKATLTTARCPRNQL